MPTAFCTVCATPIAWPQPATSGAAPVCSAAPCRLVMRQQATMHPAAFGTYLAFHVRNLRDQHAARAETARLTQEQALREADENAQHWAALQADAVGAGADADATTRLVLPSGPRCTRRLTQRRRRAYRAHLYRMLRDARAAITAGAAAVAPLPPAEADPHAPLRARLCATCAGGCCVNGGDVAYLTAATLQRVMQASPGLGARALVAAYTGRLAEETVTGSCINHTPGGCSLPRELRSDTCNRYLCEAQKSLGALPVDAVTLVIVRRQDQWTKGRPGYPNEVIGSACISAEMTRPLSMRATSPGR